MPTARTNDITTYYEVAGRGPPVVLVHGHGADLRLWDPQVPALTGADFQVVRYDVRGHGRSEAPPRGYTWRQGAADLCALLDHLGIGAAHLVGLSMGGGICLAAALEHPARARSLALIDSSLPGFTYSQAFTATVEQLVEAVRREGVTAAYRRLWLAHPLFDGLRRFPERLALVEEMLAAYSGADYLAEPEDGGGVEELVDRLAEVSVPTLVIVGELDLEDFRLAATVLAEGITGARLVVIPDAGHVARLEQPEAVNTALLDFLTGP